MDIALASKLFAALFAIMNPLTNLPIFLSLTEGKSSRDRNLIAMTGAVTTFAILVITLLAGERILGFFGITVDAFRISGGLLILFIALSMLHVQPSRIHQSEEETQEGSEKENPGIFPLAIPLLAGPGSMTTVIVFAHEAAGASGLLVCAGVILAVCALLYVAFALGDTIARWLGTTGMNVVSRIMGMLLAAIAVSMMVEGLAGAFPGLKG